MAQLSGLVEQVRATGVISPADVSAVRRALYGDDGTISLAEAEEMFALERVRRAHCREWSEMYVEALTDCVLNQQPPTGYLSAENATAS
jgi:hypothetical protein